MLLYSTSNETELCFDIILKFNHTKTIFELVFVIKKLINFFLLALFLVLWRGRYDTLKRVLWYFEDDGVVLWRGWWSTIKRVVWYFKDEWYGTLKKLYCTFKSVIFWFKEGGMTCWRGWCGNIKRAEWYFEVGGVLLYTLKEGNVFIKEGDVVLY